jgi:pteridine reductase
MARCLHHEGMDLVLHFRDSAKEAQALSDELQSERPNSVRLVQCDLLDSSQLTPLVEQVVSFKGRLDLLLNNASSFYATPFGRVDQQQWCDLLGCNLQAPFFLAQAAAPWLQESQGTIINLVDIYAEKPLAEHSVYSIAKAGNAMLVKSLATELAPRVRVNGIAPGAVLWPEGMEVVQQRRIIEQTALKRAGSAHDITDALLFLLRDARYMTGQMIHVDGGRSLYL